MSEWRKVKTKQGLAVQHQQINHEEKKTCLFKSLTPHSHQQPFACKQSYKSETPHKKYIIY